MTGRGGTGPLFFAHTLEYLEAYLPRQVGRSPQTVRAYRDSLTVFRRWLLEERGTGLSEFSFGDCDKALMMDFTDHLKRSGCAPATCNLRLAAIRGYVRFCADKDVALECVYASVSRAPLVKEPKGRKEILGPDALRAIFAAPGRTGKGVRDRTILVVLYDTAIRVAELTGLTVGDASVSPTSAGSLRIRGKGDKERVVALSDKAAGHLSAYASLFHGEGANLSDPLFYAGSRPGLRPMSEANVERIVRKYSSLARETCPEVPERVHPHMFRRTRATELYRCGVPLELVSRMLGHSTTETTKIYASPSVEMLKAAIESADAGVMGTEEPLWAGEEDALARMCGIR